MERRPSIEAEEADRGHSRKGLVGLWEMWGFFMRVVGALKDFRQETQSDHVCAFE